MRSIAGVNLRTCSGEHMYRYATKMYRKMSPTHRSRDDVYPNPFPENFSENFFGDPPTPPGRPAEGDEIAIPRR